MKCNLAMLFVFLLAGLNAFSQVDIDKSINLSGTGTNAKISGVDTTIADKDAVNSKTVQRGALVYAAATGTGAAYAVTLSPAPAGYTIGMQVNFKANVANTANVSIDVNGLGAKTIKRNVSTNLSANDIGMGQIVSVIYDGANFQLVSKDNTPSTNSSNTLIYTSDGF